MRYNGGVNVVTALLMVVLLPLAGRAADWPTTLDELSPQDSRRSSVGKVTPFPRCSPGSNRWETLTGRRCTESSTWGSDWW